MLRATLKSLLARKLRLVLSGLAVVLGVMFVAGAFVTTDTLGRTFDKLFAEGYSQVDVAVTAKPKVAVSEMEGEQILTPLPASLVDQVAAVPGVAKATGVISDDGARVIGSDGKVVTSYGPPRIGMNWVGTDDLMQMRSGRGPEKDNEIAVNEAVAKAAGIKVGDQVGVLTQLPKQTFTLVGVWGYTNDRDSIGGVQEVAFTTPQAQRSMLGKTGVFTQIYADSADGRTSEAVRDQIAARLGSDYEVKTGQQLADESSAEFKDALGFFNNILLGFAGVALFVGTFLILNTFSIIVAQRTRELALMRALGAGRRQVIGSVLVEAFVIGLVAAVLGLGAGVGVGALLVTLFGSMSGGLDPATVGVPMAAILSSLIVGVVVTVVAAVLPAVRASRISPIAAMQDVATPDRPLTKVTVTGAVIGAAGAALLGVGLYGNDSLWLILGGVLVTFIGVALLTPLISKPVVGALGRLFSWSVPGRLGRLNSGRNPRRTAITAAALMVGIALVTGVTVVIGSVKQSIATTAETTVKAEIVIGGDQNGPRPPVFDEAVLARAAAIPGVRAVGGVWNEQVLLDGERDYVTATDNLAKLADAFGSPPLPALKSDQMAVSTEVAAERGWAVGTVVKAQMPRGEEHRYTVVATYDEERVPGAIMLPKAATKEFGLTQPIVGFVRLADGATVSQVLPQVKALVADSPEVNATDRSSFVDQQLSTFDTVILMVQVLLGLAILIAVLGVINTLALSVLERTRELGLLRAVGLGRAQTMRMVTVEAVVISVFGALLGVVVGSGLGAAVVQALEGEGITELVFPWSQMAVYLGLAALVGVLAAVLPSIKAARLNVLAAIAHD
ncbi:FtsX-like permease family protein [Actinoplanes sp. TRM 88003]|uniref:FtsX-like permease family protein n=1 Tax=Paractinoplanes aksuensis TaxID=2939490 RepID=A0ABT1DJ48_9ACTN|nr:FtsX-like permease family protein [Actinoplanes aksuensis]MCO8270085.1 FtsX-like permease family protein [Actinoplanes aksuensis]